MLQLIITVLFYIGVALLLFGVANRATKIATGVASLALAVLAIAPSLF